MRTRNYDWFDERRRRPMYSFQVFVDGNWCNPCDGTALCIYETTGERDAAREKARRLVIATPSDGGKDG